jgi:hypothetical protein
MSSAGLVEETQAMRQEEPGRVGPLGPLAVLRRIIPFEAEVRRGAKHNLEDARYTRLDAEVQLARAGATLQDPQRNRATTIRQGSLQHG